MPRRFSGSALLLHQLENCPTPATLLAALRKVSSTTKDPAPGPESVEFARPAESLSAPAPEAVSQKALRLSRGRKLPTGAGSDRTRGVPFWHPPVTA